MYVITFDSETLGLPYFIDGDLPDYTWLPCYNSARLLQLSWCVSQHINSTDTLIKTQDYIIRNNYKIDNSHIHGITEQLCEQKGVSIEYAIDQFYTDLQNIRLIVGHNIQFDIHILKSELYRLIINPETSTDTKNKCEYIINSLDTIEIFDTMISATHLYNLKKWPKLTELYQRYFGQQFHDAHNAINDVIATLNCFIMMCFTSIS